MRRRDLFKGTLAVGSVAALRASEPLPSPGIFDSNVHLFPWPFRRLPLDETDKLVAKMRALHITRALAGTFEGIFHRDLTAANDRLAVECARFPELIPVASIDPSLPGWERDLAAAKIAIRLHPGPHGYTLDNPSFHELLLAAGERDLLVQLTVTLEDPRTQPEFVRMPEVDLVPLPGAMASAPAARVQLLNWKGRGPLLNELPHLPHLSTDTALVDGTDAVATLVKTFGPGRVIFGSHAPFLIPEAALVRVHEADLGDADLRAVLRENAEKWSQS